MLLKLFSDTYIYSKFKEFHFDIHFKTWEFFYSIVSMSSLIVWLFSYFHFLSFHLTCSTNKWNKKLKNKITKPKHEKNGINKSDKNVSKQNYNMWSRTRVVHIHKANWNAGNSHEWMNDVNIVVVTRPTILAQQNFRVIYILVYVCYVDSR